MAEISQRMREAGLWTDDWIEYKHWDKEWGGYFFHDGRHGCRRVVDGAAKGRREMGILESPRGKAPVSKRIDIGQGGGVRWKSKLRLSLIALRTFRAARLANGLNIPRLHRDCANDKMVGND